MSKLLNISDKYAQAKRGSEIIKTVFRYGLDELFDRTKLAENFSFSETRLKGTNKLSTPERVRLALEELGPTFIKFGQVLSTRPDILPAKYITEFEKLQDGVASFPYTEVKRLVRLSFNKPLEKIFPSFDREPVASASIAQVHIAKLPNGQKVAVKIKRPGIEEKIATDTAIILELAKFLKNRDLVDETWQPVELAKEFARTIKEELDFSNELANLKKFQINFTAEKTIKIPQAYEEYCNSEIITMDYIAGSKLKTIINDKKGRYPKKEIAIIAANAGLKQIFIDKFFHGDLHPGNIFWLDKSKQLALIDFGRVCALSREEGRALVMMLSGLLNQDANQIVFALENLNIISSSQKADEIREAIEKLLNKYYNATVKDIKIAVLIQEIFDLMLKYRLRLPANFVMMAKSLVSSDGIAAQIDPDFNMFTFCRPYVEQAAREELSFDNLKKEGGQIVRQSWRLFSDLPNDVYWLLKNLKNNDFRVKVSHDNLEKLLAEITLSANRLSFSLIVAALIIGSSYVINNFRTLGLAGYLIASLFGFCLLVSMFRTKKL